VIVDDERLREISRARTGELSEVPFATLLFALWRHGRTCVLELSRGELRKGVVLEDGTPVDCESNLLHETLGKFLVAEGKLTEEQYQEALTEAASVGESMGTALIRTGKIAAFDLFRALQQNLARKLLDMFTWETGRYRVLGDAPEIDSALKVNVPQLVLTGIERFAPKKQVDLGCAPFIGADLTVDPRAHVDVDSLRLNAPKARMVQTLKRRLRIDEVMREASVSAEEAMRFLCALGVMRIARLSDEVPDEPEPKPVEPSQPVERAAPAKPVEQPAPAPATSAAHASVEEVMSLYVNHRRLDAFDLLGLPEDAEQPARAEAWLSYAERFAPWAFADDEGRKVQDKARDLFLAGARAFGELGDAERRNSLVNRRRNLSKNKQPSGKYSFAIRTDLLDAGSQYGKGRMLMSQGKYREAEDLLAYAADLSPGNGEYRSELLYCRFLQHPDALAAQTVEGLEEVSRMDPGCGVAWLYKGEVHTAEGQFDHARASYERAARLMGADPRPRDALARIAGR
jgi:hypothetical protein